MPTTAEQAIYNRLAAAPTFHPSTVDLFTNWNMQAGDVVTVKSDSDSYQVPVYSMKLKWTGAPKVEVESTGNPEREPLPAMKRREYASNSSSNSEFKKLSGGYGSTLEKVAKIDGILYAAGLQIDPVSGVLMYATQQGADFALGASLKVQADAITAEVTRATTAEGTMSSRITQTADAITAEVTRATTAEGTLSGRITVEAGKISQIVSSVGADGQVTAASIVLAVNAAGSSVVIDADKVNLTGYVTANQLEAAFATARNLTYLTASGTTISNSGGIYSGHFYLNLSGGQVELGDAVGSIGPASSSGGQITIPWTTLRGASGTAVTFNIADTQYYRDAVASAYNNGWDAARGFVSAPAAGTSASMTVGIPASTVNQGSSYDFTVSADNSYAYIKNAVNTVVARVSNPAYSNGYTAGETAGQAYGYAQGWNAANNQYSQYTTYTPYRVTDRTYQSYTLYYKVASNVYQEAGSNFVRVAEISETLYKKTASS